MHARMAAVLRGHLNLILDTCSVRAEGGGELAGRSATDQGKRDTRDDVAVDGEGRPESAPRPLVVAVVDRGRRAVLGRQFAPAAACIQ
jgi:hypothetical protein